MSRKVWGYILLAAALLSVTGCDGELPPRRAVVVLVDETSWGHTYWNEVTELVAEKVVANLRPGDAFALIGIDAHGFDDADVRLALTWLPESFLPAQLQKKDLSAKVRSLEKRPVEDLGTDILGALTHAAHFLDRAVREGTSPSPAGGRAAGGGTDEDMAARGAGVQPVLLVFSDMIPDLRWPSSPEVVGRRLKQWKMPANTRVEFLYVAERGAAEWKELVTFWKEAFAAAGLSVDEYNFHVPKLSPRALDRLFKR